MMETLKHSIELKHVPVNGPQGEPMIGPYLYDNQSKTAFIEVAALAGLQLVPEERRNPFTTSSRAIGQVIRHAYE